MKVIPLGEEVGMHLNLREEPGWMGVFTRDEAVGAIRNGTPIVKVAKDAGDVRDIGATGTVLGSLHHPQVGTGYFIEWDAQLKVAVFCVGWKIGPKVAQ